MPRTSPPFSSAARSNVSPWGQRRVGHAPCPCTRSRATPPSGVVLGSQYGETGTAVPHLEDMRRVAPSAATRAPIFAQRAAAELSRSRGIHPKQVARLDPEQACGKFRVKSPAEVSTTTACTTPGAPSRTITESDSTGPAPAIFERPRAAAGSPTSRTPAPCARRSNSETDIAPGVIRFSFSAKNSSDAATTSAPRWARDARSGKALQGSRPGQAEVLRPSGPPPRREQPSPRRDRTASPPRRPARPG